MTRAAEIPHAIQWHDGMLLSPQHFQEADRRAERLLAYHVGHAARYHWGVERLEIELGPLVSGIFRVREIEAVMPDGTLVTHPYPGEGGADLSLDMRPHAALLRDAPATVFLAVPRQELGGPSSGAELARHRSIAGAPVIDEHTGDDPLHIPRIVPSARLIVAAEPPPRLVCLPIARVRLDGEAFVRTDYVPPLLGVAPSSPIGEMCQRVAATLREKAQRLSEKVGMRSRTTDRDRIAEERSQIHSLVAALPPFEALLDSDRPHPFSLFLAFAGLFGQLAFLSRSHVPPRLPAYRHHDLRATFERARTDLLKMIDEGIIESFNAYPFDLRGGRYGVMFQREFRGKLLILQARTRTGTRDEDLLAWINSSLMGANDKLRVMQESRILGAGRESITREGELVASPGTLLFKVESASPYLDPSEPFIIANTADPDAERGPLELVLYVKAD